MSPPMTGRWAMRVAMIGRRHFLTLPEARRVRANRPRPWPTAPSQQPIQWSCRLLAPSTNESTRQGQHRQRGSFRSLRGWISSATLMPLQDAAMSHVVSRTRQLTGSILPSGKRAERAHLPKKHPRRSKSLPQATFAHLLPRPQRCCAQATLGQLSDVNAALLAAGGGRIRRPAPPSAYTLDR